MDIYDRERAIERIHALRRRYMSRVIRAAARSVFEGVRTPRGKTVLASLFGVAVITAPLWLAPRDMNAETGAETAPATFATPITD